MKRLAAALMALLMGGQALAQAPAPVADPLALNAQYGFIMDGDTGQPLYCYRCDEQMIPASMSKLMLYYIVFERIKEGRLKLTDEFTVSEHAWRTGGAGTDGSTMFLKLNSKVSVENLLRGAVIQSGNDACITLAEGLAGSEKAFAEMMNEKAKVLGLTRSHFANATGLDDPGQYMSARDIGLLGYALIKEFPKLYPMFSESEFTWNGIRQQNRNPLLKEIDGADGMKTGHLSKSGFGLIGSAVRDGKRRIIVLQGLESEDARRREGARVMRAAFSDFVSKTLVKAGAEVAVANVWLGKKKSVPLLAQSTLDLSMHLDTAKSISAVVHYKGPLKAPLKKNQVVGELIFTGSGLTEQRIPVVVAEDVPKMGLFGRAAMGFSGN